MKCTCKVSLQKVDFYIPSYIFCSHSAFLLTVDRCLPYFFFDCVASRNYFPSIYIYRYLIWKHVFYSAFFSTQQTQYKWSLGGVSFITFNFFESHLLSLLPLTGKLLKSYTTTSASLVAPFQTQSTKKLRPCLETIWLWIHSTETHDSLS